MQFIPSMQTIQKHTDCVLWFYYDVPIRISNFQKLFDLITSNQHFITNNTSYDINDLFSLFHKLFSFYKIHSIRYNYYQLTNKQISGKSILHELHNLSLDICYETEILMFEIIQFTPLHQAINSLYTILYHDINNTPYKV
jgi:hypothetical protein